MKKLNSIFLHIFNVPKLFSILLLFFVSIANAQVDCDNDIIPPNIDYIDSIYLNYLEDKNLNIVSAKHFDYGFLLHGQVSSFDNCTARDDLDFSYSLSKSDTLKTLLELKQIARGDSSEIEIYVFDEKGNFSIANVLLKIYEIPQNYIGAEIKNRNFNYFSNFDNGKMNFIVIDNKNDTVPKIECDFSNGQIYQDIGFCVDTVGHPLPYTIYYNYASNLFFYMNSLDFFLLRKKLMGDGEFDFCNTLSLDLNYDNNVSISDIYDIRSHILGFSTNIPNLNLFEPYENELERFKRYFPKTINELPDPTIKFTIVEKGNRNYSPDKDFDCERELADTFKNNYLSNDSIKFELIDLGEESGIHILKIKYIDTIPIKGFQFSMTYDTNFVNSIKIIDSEGNDYDNLNYNDIEGKLYILSDLGYRFNKEKKVCFTLVIEEKNTNSSDILELLDFDDIPIRLETTDTNFISYPIKLNYRKEPYTYKIIAGQSYVDWDIFDLDIEDANGTEIEDYYYLTSDVTNENEPTNYKLIFKDLDYERPFLVDIIPSKYPNIGTIDYDDMDLLAHGIIRNDSEDSDLIELGDVNCDGKASILDIYHIYDYIFKNNEMPCGGFYFYWKDQTDSIMKFPVEVDSVIPDLHLYLKGDLNYRNTDTLYMAYEKKEIITSDDILLNLYPQTDEKIFGIQCDLNLDTSAVELVQVVKKTNAVVNNYQKISGNSLLSLAYQRTHAGDLNKIFTRLRLNIKKDIETKDILSIGNAISAQAVTYDGEILPISLIEYKPDKTAENEIESSINVYPNPSNSTINITGINSNHETLKIFDVIGRQIIGISLKEKRKSCTIDISELHEGIYFIKIGNKLNKFIKK